MNKIFLKHVLVVPFLGLIFLSVALVGYVSMHHGRQAVNQVANALRNEIGSRIVDHLNRFLTLPHQINQVNAEQVNDLLDNLLQNSCEAMEEKNGRIEVDMGTANQGDIPQKFCWPGTSGSRGWWRCCSRCGCGTGMTPTCPRNRAVL